MGRRPGRAAARRDGLHARVPRSSGSTATCASSASAAARPRSSPACPPSCWATRRERPAHARSTRDARVRGQPGRAAREDRRARRRARQGGGRRRREVRRSGTTSAASCSCANASNCCSIPARRFLELSPLAAWGSDYTVGAAVVCRHRGRQGRRVHDQRHRPDGARRRVQPVHAQEGAARQRDRAGRTGCPVIGLVESGGADLPTQKEIFIPGGRCSATSPGSRRRASRRSRWCSATRPRAARTSPA